MTAAPPARAGCSDASFGIICGSAYADWNFYPADYSDDEIIGIAGAASSVLGARSSVHTFGGYAVEAHPEPAQ